MKNLKLEIKIILIVAITLFVSFGIVLSLALKKEKLDIMNQYKSKIGLLGDSVITSIRLLMMEGNAIQAQELVSNLKKIEGLESLEIIRADGSAAYRDISTIEDVNERLGSITFSRQPLPPVIVMDESSSKLMEAVTNSRKLEYYEKVNGTEIYTQLIPLLNEESCHGCHGELTKVRGLLKISTSLQKINLEIIDNRNRMISVFVFLSFIIALGLWWMLRKTVVSPIRAIENGVRSIGEGNFNVKVEVKTGDEIGSLAVGFNRMSEGLKNTYDELEDKIAEISKKNLQLEEQSSTQEMYSEVVTSLASSIEMKALLSNSLREIVSHTKSSLASVYLYNEENNVLKTIASVGVSRNWAEESYKTGEGFAGECAESKTRKVCSDIPSETKFVIRSILGEALPKNILAEPIMYQDKLIGVLELGSLLPFTDEKLQVIGIVTAQMGIAIQHARAYETTQDLLKKQKETNAEITAANEELQAQTQELQAQTEELQAQTEELLAQSQELENRGEELKRKSKEVEEANLLKSEFLSNMSHELRTPLNSIMALNQLLLDGSSGKINKEQKQYLEIVDKNSRDLLNLINDILDISKIEAGRVELVKTTFNLKELVASVQAAMKPMASGKGIKLETKFARDLPSITTDKDRLKQILLNLVGNAVKFTDKGRVDIMAETAGPDFIKCRIIDTGIGIPPEKQEHIFDKFTQVDGSTSRTYGGTGLGLAITKELVDLLGGQIDVESAVGKGSSFSFTLPLKDRKTAVGKEAPVMPKPSLPLPKLKKHGTILVVDDDEKVLELLKGFLEENQYKVITANRGEHVIEIAKREKPFAITLDLVLPDTDGWEVLSGLKSCPETSQIPVIILSISDDMETGFALGASGYIVKPFKKEQILREIKMVGGKRKFKRILVVDDNPIDLDGMKNLFGGSDYEVAIANSGKEGLAKAASICPDIIILDLMMPEMDGFEVLNQLKKGALTKNIPVFIMTAKDLSAEERRLLGKQTRAVVSKGSLAGAHGEALLADIRTILNEMDVELKKIAFKDRKKELKGGSVQEVQGKKEHILIVEDNEIAAKQIITILKNEDYRISWANLAKNGLDTVGYGLPNVIILDIMMPGMDGFDFLDELAKIPGGAKVPVLILTAKELTRIDRERLDGHHVREVITKGTINKESLLEKINLLFSREREQEPQDRYIPVFSVDSTRKEGGRKTILIVEDNEDNLFTIKEILKNIDCDIIEARDGEAALELIFSQAVDLILLDIQLPKLSGHEVADIVRRDKNFKDLPIIALTANAMRKDQEKCIEAGCNDCIIKPVNPKETLEKVKRWMD